MRARTPRCHRLRQRFRMAVSLWLGRCADWFEARSEAWAENYRRQDATSPPARKPHRRAEGGSLKATKAPAYFVELSDAGAFVEAPTDAEAVTLFLKADLKAAGQ